MSRFLSAVCLVMVMNSFSQASTLFSAQLTGDQEVGPQVTSASGSAVLELNDTEDRLVIDIQLNGLDLDGLQTADPNDDVIGAHIHAAPAGINGGVVFGFIGINSDTNADLVVNAAAGTIHSAWDLGEGNGTTLAAQLPALVSKGLYINIHTNRIPGGEIRGQIIPEPAGCALALVAAALAATFRRRTVA
jgi:CHRD domain